MSEDFAAALNALETSVNTTMTGMSNQIAGLIAENEDLKYRLDNEKIRSMEWYDLYSESVKENDRATQQMADLYNMVYKPERDKYVNKKPEVITDSPPRPTLLPAPSEEQLRRSKRLRRTGPNNVPYKNPRDGTYPE